MVLSLVVSARRCFSSGFVFQRCFVCLFRHGFVFVLGGYFDVVGNRSSSNVFVFVVGCFFQCCWKSQFKHCFVVVLGCFCKCCWESQF